MIVGGVESLLVVHEETIPELHKPFLSKINISEVIKHLANRGRRGMGIRGEEEEKGYHDSTFIDVVFSHSTASSSSLLASTSSGRKGKQV